jgi:hypothetical protein
MRLPGFGGGQKGPGPIGQGTRATLAQGTLNGPKGAPTVTSFGPVQDTGASPGAPGTIVQNAGWPYNPVQPILAPAGGRESQIKTDYELNIGPAPRKIMRQLWNRMNGEIGPDNIASFPYNAEWSFLPHQYVPRNPQGAGPYLKGMDDTAPIPAVFAGNPRR